MSAVGRLRELWGVGFSVSGARMGGQRSLDHGVHLHLDPLVFTGTLKARMYC